MWVNRFGQVTVGTEDHLLSPSPSAVLDDAILTTPAKLDEVIDALRADLGEVVDTLRAGLAKG
jgi:hypothetical protein